MVGGLFSHKKSLDEVEEEVERKESENRLAGLEFSIAQKREMTRRLKQRGLSPKHFGDTAVGATWSKIWAWLKAH